MKPRLIFWYQLLAAASDGGTGLLLVFAPALTLRLMRLFAPQDALVYLSYVGVFVLSTGLACLYGAWLARDPIDSARLETVWLLTAVTRVLVGIFVVAQIVNGSLAPGWIAVAITDALFALVQFTGLAKGWLRHAAR